MNENEPVGAAPSRREFIEYVEVPLRRPLHVLIPLVVITVGAVVSSFMVKKKYKSSTLITMEAEKVPDNFVPRMVTRTEKQLFMTLNQEVLSRTRLERVVQEVNPYPERMGRQSLTTIVESMRNDIVLMMQKKGDAFSVDYYHTDPKLAMAVANRIATVFIEETSLARGKQVSEAAQFIDQQLEEARRTLETKEEALRRYKERHMGSLPDQLNANLSTLQRLQSQQQATAEQLRAAKDRQIMLQKNLSDQMRDPGGAAPSDPFAELTKANAQLAMLRTRYTDEHPDVRALIVQIAQIQRQLAAAPAPSETPLPVSAAALPFRQQLDAADIEVRTLTTKLADLDERITSFQARVERAPANEQEFTSLTRDTENLKTYYLTLLNKKLDAQMAERLEERWKGEHFRLLDPASMPERPVFPNRFLFLIQGLLAGLTVGLGIAFAAELLDHSIKNARELEATFPYPVLAMIPALDTAAPASVPPATGGFGS